jgi:hypothetical protein
MVIGHYNFHTVLEVFCVCLGFLNLEDDFTSNVSTYLESMASAILLTDAVPRKLIFIF